MLDQRLFRQELEQTARALRIKGFELDVASVDLLESSRKNLQIQTEELQAKRNAQSKAIGKAKAEGLDIEHLLSEVSELGDQLDAKKQELEAVKTKLDGILMAVPNIPDTSVPEGATEEDNVLVRTWSAPGEFSFTPKDHVDLTNESGLINFEQASKIAGSRFVVMRGGIARMHRALTQFMLDTHIQKHGYEEVYVPYIVNQDSLIGTGQLPKFEEDLFKLEGDRDFYLTSTAEVPVTNLARGEIIDASAMPQKFVCHTPCFRSEAGSYGKDTKGMIRQHQFEKVELVMMVRAEDSWTALEELTGHAEVILQKLGLPYRVVNLCGGDLGFAAAKTYDLEVWLPGQNKYREISSCSNFLDFQARRMQARWRNPDTGRPELIHTLNGSGLAIGRTLVAVLENYQLSDGSVAVPESLQPYLAGETTIALGAD